MKLYTVLTLLIAKILESCRPRSISSESSWRLIQATTMVQLTEEGLTSETDLNKPDDDFRFDQDKKKCDSPTFIEDFHQVQKDHLFSQKSDLGLITPRANRILPEVGTAINQTETINFCNSLSSSRLLPPINRANTKPIELVETECKKVAVLGSSTKPVGVVSPLPNTRQKATTNGSGIFDRVVNFVNENEIPESIRLNSLQEDGSQTSASSGSSLRSRDEAIQSSTSSGENSSTSQSSIFETPRRKDDDEIVALSREELAHAGWYYGRISSSQAKALLAGEEVGTFLLRDSASGRHPFALSAVTPRGVTSVRIAYSGGQFYLDCEKTEQGRMPKFNRVEDLVRYHMGRSTDEWVGSRDEKERKRRVIYMFVEADGKKDTAIKLTRMLIAKRL